MTGNTVLSYFVVIALGASLFSSCNKDEVIESSAPTDKGEYREPSETSDRFSTTVYDYTPAPGQFINEKATGGMESDITTMEEACRWAQSRLDKRQFVSLGGFGGYIVVGFDHSLLSSHGDYDFAIAGNAYFNSLGDGGSNEPGIVYVMQDSNGNGLPDDVWYELKGSEHNFKETIHDYSVTYYRPETAGAEIDWQDNLGNSGCIDYLPEFHNQDSYYPAWIKEDSYTLSGTCLKPRNEKDPSTGLWNNPAYGYGYADNMGSDNTGFAGFPQCNRFRISDAVSKNGNPTDLEYIDFVKVQTGTNTKSGWLGELSTEVFGVFDLNL